MNNAPFSLTAILYGTIASSVIIGGIFGFLFGLIGFSSVFAGTILAVIAGIAAGVVRQHLANKAAEAENIDNDGTAPVAFSTPIRIAIITVLGFIVSYMLIGQNGMSMGFFTGALIGLITSLGAVIIFSVRMMTK